MKKKFSKIKNLKKHIKNQNFEKSSSAFFVPFPFDLSIRTIHNESEKLLFRGGGEGGYQTVNNGTADFKYKVTREGYKVHCIVFESTKCKLNVCLLLTGFICVLFTVVMKFLLFL